MSPELETALRAFFGKEFYFIAGVAQMHFKNNDEARAAVFAIRQMLGVVHGSAQQELPLA